VLSIQTGSMMPTLRPGDAVVVSRASTAGLRCGDIISYHSPTNPGITITHRLQRVEPANGWLITKGDAASQPDSAFPPRLLVGRVVAVGPGLGRVLDDLHRPLGLALGVYLPAAGLVGAEGWRLWRSIAGPPAKRYRLQSV
jgi:signal peptidase I